MKRTILVLLLCFPAAVLQAQQTVSEQIVVSATKLPEQEVDVPADTTVITPAELRARGVHTLSDALATASGVEAFDGSDQGSGLANVALRGLKEFDAYLVEVNGVPVGGTFDPDLQQIDVRSIDRIEIVRGPAGVVHGSTAFAGVISIYTREAKGSHAEVAGGSFGTGEVRYATGAQNWRVSAIASKADGWRPRTDEHRAQLDLNWSSTNVKLRVFGLDRKENFGAPLPMDSDTGQLPEGIGYNTNLALQGAQVGARDFGFTSRYAIAGLNNVFGYTHRNQRLARTFVDNVDGADVEGAGTNFRPHTNDVFEDLRFDLPLPEHHLLAGISANYGSLDSAGTRFDLAYSLDGPIPSIGDIAGKTPIHVTDKRLFAGMYAEDEWTPLARLTATGGLRYDRDREKRTFESEEETSRQSRNDGAFSSRLGLVYRMLSGATPSLDAANVYIAANNTFKPAAFDPAPQEDEGLLEPEKSRGIEGGFKFDGAKQRWHAAITAFNTNLTNLVVSENIGGNPTRVNAGEIRLRGVELSGDVRPAADLTLRAGVAFHDPRFVHFTAVNETGDEEIVDGHLLELVAKRSANIAAVYAPASSFGGSIALHYVGPRALDRDNVYFTPAFTTLDASVYFPFRRTRFEIVGRNLTNKRFVTTDSELQDGLRYISAPRAFIARLSFDF